MAEAVTIVKKTKLPKRSFAHVNNIGPYQGDTALFERLFNKVMDWASSKNLLTEMTESISIYHDDPEAVPAENQRISVGFTVPEGTVSEGEILLTELPESEFVVGSFEINADEYGEAWEQMMNYINEQGLIPTGLMYESYKNDPREHPEGKHIVDICIAI